MSFYTREQFEILLTAMELASKQLGIRPVDKGKRERLALLIARSGCAAHGDAQKLKDIAVARFEYGL